MGLVAGGFSRWSKAAPAKQAGVTDGWAKELAAAAFGERGQETCRPSFSNRSRQAGGSGRGRGVGGAGSVAVAGGVWWKGAGAATRWTGATGGGGWLVGAETRRPCTAGPALRPARKAAASAAARAGAVSDGAEADEDDGAVVADMGPPRTRLPAASTRAARARRAAKLGRAASGRGGASRSGAAGGRGSWRKEISPAAAPRGRPSRACSCRGPQFLSCRGADPFRVHAGLWVLCFTWANK